MNESLKMDDDIELEGDSLGGSYLLESDAYNFVIDMAYFDKSEGGATSINMNFKNKNGKTLKYTGYITSGTAKGCKNYYMVKDRSTKKETGEKRYLPDFSKANSICNLAIGANIGDIATEEKKVMIYDFKSRAEKAEDREVLMDLLGSEITLGVLQEIIDKTAKNAAGVYVPNGETRTVNVIDKAFRTSDFKTSTEIAAETDSEFYTKWVEKNKGTINDKSTKVEGTAGTPESGGTKSLI